MNDSSTLEQELFTQIEAELEQCSASTTPIICSNLTNPEAKATLVRTIADTCLKCQVSIASAIVMIERGYSLNDID